MRCPWIVDVGAGVYVGRYKFKLNAIPEHNMRGVCVFGALL